MMIASSFEKENFGQLANIILFRFLRISAAAKQGHFKARRYITKRSLDPFHKRIYEFNLFFFPSFSRFY